MKKIPSVFCRNYDSDHLIRDEIVPGCEWVIAGEGIATRKWDGTSCLVRGGNLFKRYDAKRGKTPPLGFEPAQEPDPVTGHHTGWLPVVGAPEDRWHLAALADARIWCTDGTYELCGPAINSNPERFSSHVLIRHGIHPLPDAPRTFDGLRAYLANVDMEGVVFWHPDGRMAKVKVRDFGHIRTIVVAT